MNNRFRQLKMLFFVLLLLPQLSCNDPEDEDCPACTKAASLVNRAKKQIGAGNFGDAIDTCDLALKSDPNSSDAHYCLVIAHLGNMSFSVNSILAQLGSILPSGAPGMAPPFKTELDYKQIVRGLTDDVENEMLAVDEQLYFLSSQQDVKFQIKLFPIQLKFSRIAEFYNTYLLDGSTQQLPGEVIFDAGGTWDRSELVLLGAAFNTILGVLDYAMAHDLNVRQIPASENLYSRIGEMLVMNRNLLRFEPNQESKNRIEGGEGRKGLKNDFVAALSYVSGRDTELAGAVPINPGIKLSIVESAALDATDSVIVWIDDDGDGNPEAIESTALSDIGEQLTGIRLARFPMILSPDSLEAFYKFSSDLLNNIESKGDPVAVAPFLDGLRADVGGFLGVPSIANKPIPDLVALDAGAFLSKPMPARKLFPMFFADEDPYQQATNYNLLYDWESLNYGVLSYSFQWHDSSWHWGNELTHFVDLPEANFAEFTPLSGMSLSDDGVNPNDSVTSLLYIGLQNPNFGGLLYLNPRALGSSEESGLASNQTINEALARLFKYYCFDFRISYSLSLSPIFRPDCPTGSESQ